MKLQYSLRPATEADYAYCYRIARRNMYDLICRHWGCWLPASFRKGFDVANTTLVIVNGRRAGYLCLKRDAEGVYLDNIQLSPPIQGRGIGASILKEILDEHRFETISLTVFVDNPARHLYERLGFIATGRDGGAIHMIRTPGLS